MSTRIIYFMYHHAHHCVIPREPQELPSQSSFTLFALLPTELRLKVWEAFADTPRMVEITCTPTASHIPEGRWFSHSKGPVIFRVCSESRYVALSKVSVLKFSSNQIGFPPSMKLYINFSSETLFLCGDLQARWARDLLEKNEQLRTKLKYLYVKEKLWKELNPVDLTPMRNTADLGAKQQTPQAIRGYLKALVDVKFHVHIVSMP